MNRIAKFHKVSLPQFTADWMDTFGGAEAEARAVYEGIRLPARATAGSAGYDFYAPHALTLLAGETVKVPTGVRAQMAEGWVLQIFPRSGLGFKFRLQMDNTVGIIDSDYFGAENEGHIFIKMTNCSTAAKTVSVAAGAGFAQGIFLPFGITEDDEADGVRLGGFGSTT
ncbi:MAG: deoxyuridine 5'-triphosphate nucleotidohydrolase [Intestinibacillus sp.]